MLISFRRLAHVTRPAFRALTMCVLGGLACSAQAATAEVPARKAGLWHIRTISDAFGTREIDACVTAADPLIPASPGATCQPARVASTASETIVTLECSVGEDRQVTSILFTGDFETWYRGQAKMTISKSAAPQVATTTLGFNIDANFIGDCP